MTHSEPAQRSTDEQNCPKCGSPESEHVVNDAGTAIFCPTYIEVPEERFYAFVQCRGDSVPGQQPCGLIGLTEAEYSRQLDKPDVSWWCPHCGSSADYDDAASEEAQGVNYEPPEPDGECYRGGEAAAALAESQAWIQRNLK